MRQRNKLCTDRSSARAAARSCSRISTPGRNRTFTLNVLRRHVVVSKIKRPLAFLGRRAHFGPNDTKRIHRGAPPCQAVSAMLSWQHGIFINKSNHLRDYEKLIKNPDPAGQYSSPLQSAPPILQNEEDSRFHFRA